MPLTNVGAQCIADLMAGNGGVIVFSSANARVGVGDNNTAFSAAQTDLIGTSTRKLVTSVTGAFPSQSRIYTAEFTTSEANYAWLEVGLFNAASSGQMAVRKVVALPTKTSSESWTVNLTVNWAAA